MPFTVVTGWLASSYIYLFSVSSDAGLGNRLQLLVDADFVLNETHVPLMILKLILIKVDLCVVSKQQPWLTCRHKRSRLRLRDL